MNRRAVGRPLASGNSPISLVGREAELGRIGECLASARAGSGALLLIEGQPGIGKTALLGGAEELAPDARCLWVHGVESEAVLGAFLGSGPDEDIGAPVAARSLASRQR